nr:protein kinase [Myxococcales bacterium]
MDVERYQKAIPIFHQLVELPPDQREAHLVQACQGDAALEAIVRKLVAEDAATTTLPVGPSPLSFVDLPAPEPTPHVLNPGDRLGRYEVRRRIGVGGTAEVWAVRHTALGTVHAVKVLTHASEALAERLRREGRAQSRLAHPHILPIRDILEVGGQPALLMPLVTGPSLATLLQARRLPTAEALALFSAVLSGVAFAHQHGVVHRDLKPGNVLLAPIGDQLTPQVADFGLVKEAGSVRVTRTGAAMGTPAYMAPEQHDDAAHVDARADLFGLGTMLVEMLTGHRPFAGDSLQAIRRAWQQPPDLRDAPEALLELLTHMLQPDPADRIGSCAEVADRLGQTDLTVLARGTPLFTTALALGAPLLETLAGTTGVDEDANVPVHTVPRARDAFVGRDAELQDLQARLTDNEPPRLVTVLGPGGAGKTRFCRELAHRTLPNWPGGVWWVELADTTDRDGVLAATARGLDVPLRGDGVAMLGQVIDNRGRCLVVIDNVEQVVQHMPDTLGAWLDAAPLAVFLCTSRQPVRLRGEQRIDLGPLPTDDGVALFVERARAVDASFELAPERQPQVAHLVELLDGLPLAIELAAARSRMLSPTQLRERLQRRFRLLRSRSDDVAPRQRTLEATLAWSWDLLSPTEQTALAQLGVFEGGFTVEAAEAVLELPADDDGEPPWIDDVLAELVDKSLVRRTRSGSGDTHRLGLLVSVQAFARGKLGSEAAAVEARHGAWCAQIASADSDARCRVELDNLSAAATRAVDRGDTAVATACTRAAARERTDVGPVRAALELLERALAMPRLSDAQRAELQIRQAWSTVISRPPTDAVPIAQRAVTHARASGHPGLLADALRTLADALCRARRPEEGLALAEEAMPLAKADGGVQVQLDAASTLGTLHAAREDHAEALRIYDRATALAARSAVPASSGLLLRRCLSLRSIGLIAEATAAAEEALATAQAEGHRSNLGYTLVALAQLHGLAAEMTLGKERAAAALSVYRHIGDVMMTARTVALQSQLHLHARQLAEADEACRRALEAADELGFPPFRAACLRNEILRHQIRGDLAAGLAAAEEALAIHRASGDRRNEGLVFADLGALYYADGDLDTAAAYFHQASSPSEPISGVSAAPWGLLGLGLVALERCQLHDAVARLQQAREHPSCFPSNRAKALFAEVLAHTKAGRGEQATERLQEALATSASMDTPEVALWSACARAATATTPEGEASAWRDAEQASHHAGDVELPALLVRLRALLPEP